MIRSIIDELKAGNTKIPEMFANLETMWSEKLHNIESMSEVTLAEVLSQTQWEVERICDNNRYLGKAIMPWSAFAHLYSADVGYEDKGTQALKLSRAFEQSTCSLEVKSGATEASEVYYVSDFA